MGRKYLTRSEADCYGFAIGGEFKLQVHHEPQAKILHGASGIRGIFVGGYLTF